MHITTRSHFSFIQDRWTKLKYQSLAKYFKGNLVKIPNFFVDLTTTERGLFNIVDFNFKAITLN